MGGDGTFGDVVNAHVRLGQPRRLADRLVLVMIQIESDFNPGAVLPRKAMGLMQFTPDTAFRFGLVLQFDSLNNIQAGMAYLC